ncbi:MAG: [FeFe] hydrogenase H-cluster maturation GTPase HydF [Clostridiales bacterium]|nr:[FeFe] hydrogenase H-cluster maturation GTPase HydF [Clostridiales bacterium]
MSLNETPRAQRTHIAFFGRRNVGKSSIVNAITGQAMSVVSDVKGTTTDPVFKTMELLPLGPVVIVDTPGFDDEGALGDLRVQKTREILEKTDIAVLIIDATLGKSPIDDALMTMFHERNIPSIVVYNKTDLTDAPIGGFTVSAATGEGIHALKERMATMIKPEGQGVKFVADLIQPNDFVVLVTPIDAAAPKGRMILPQQQAIRDVLDAGAIAIVTRELELARTLASLGKTPAIVITDSQAFQQVAIDVPQDIPLTSFSILMARYKGFLETAVRGISAIEALKDGDRVLISEGCTHHRQCGDIGSVKLPNWLRSYTGCNLEIELTSGASFPEDLSPYRMVIHCGGCMLNERAVTYRMNNAVRQGVPFTNYGISIAYMKGILKRSISMFPDLLSELDT